MHRRVYGMWYETILRFIYCTVVQCRCTYIVVAWWLQKNPYRSIHNIVRLTFKCDCWCFECAKENGIKIESEREREKEGIYDESTMVKSEIVIERASQGTFHWTFRTFFTGVLFSKSFAFLVWACCCVLSSSSLLRVYAQLLFFILAFFAPDICTDFEYSQRLHRIFTLSHSLQITLMQYNFHQLFFVQLQISDEVAQCTHHVRAMNVITYTGISVKDAIQRARKRMGENNNV